jgi:hypothetical protein
MHQECSMFLQELMGRGNQGLFVLSIMELLLIFFLQLVLAV